MGMKSKRQFYRNAALAAAASLLLGSASAFAASPSASQAGVERSVPALLFDRSSPVPEARIDAALRDLARRDLFSGVVLIARGDEILFNRAYGLASREYNVPARADMRFNLASANKMFTAVAIGQLVEQGKVRFDAPISTYLDASWVAPEIGRKITVANLLTHTSGLPNYMNDTWRDASRAKYKTLEDFRSLVPPGKLDFEPGTQWRYNNTGFLVLGAIIEKVSGQSYEEYIGRNILEPSGMTHTANLDLEEVNVDYAQGYMKRPRKPSARPAVAPGRDDWAGLITQTAARMERERADGVKITNNIFQHVARGGPAGGMYSTATDMLKFLNAFRAGKLVSPEMVKVMTSPKPLSQIYGYGMEMVDGGIGHSGGFPGIGNTNLAYNDGYRLIILSNIDNGSMVAQAKLIELAKPNANSAQ